MSATNMGFSRADIHMVWPREEWTVGGSQSTQRKIQKKCPVNRCLKFYRLVTTVRRFIVRDIEDSFGTDTFYFLDNLYKLENLKLQQSVYLLLGKLQGILGRMDFSPEDCFHCSGTPVSGHPTLLFPSNSISQPSLVDWTREKSMVE